MYLFPCLAVNNLSLKFFIHLKKRKILTTIDQNDENAGKCEYEEKFYPHFVTYCFMRMMKAKRSLIVVHFLGLQIIFIEKFTQRHEENRHVQFSLLLSLSDVGFEEGWNWSGKFGKEKQIFLIEKIKMERGGGWMLSNSVFHSVSKLFENLRNTII